MLCQRIFSQITLSSVSYNYKKAAICHKKAVKLMTTSLLVAGPGVEPGL